MLKLKLFINMLRLEHRDQPGLWLERLLFLLGPIVSYAAVEILNDNSPFALQMWRMLWNFVWYYVLYALAWLVTGSRKRCAAVLAASLLYVFGLINHYVLRFRGTMFFPIDIFSWRTAANVASGYDYTPDGKMLLALAITAVYILLWFIPRKKGAAKYRSGKSFRICAATLLAAFLCVFFSAGFLPSINLYAEQWLTQRNGFVFNFMLSLRYGFASEPYGYSVELVDDIQAQALELQVGAEEPDQPEQPENILIIMNESLADLSIYENYSASADPLEFIHGLEENTVSGWVFSPVVGGGTANVEYEALTCNPACFLPDGTIAYQMYVDEDIPSLASLAGEQGYESYAFHPYLASGWNRVQAYDHLGFDHQIYDEDLSDPDYVRDYISDSSDFRYLTRITEENEGKTFVFNVTMQNHSGYSLPWTNLEDSVRPTGELKGVSREAHQYLCLVDETDEAFRELIEYYESSDEPTLIAMFGDHQPPLSNDFYDLLMGSAQEERSAEEELQKYVTPFVIWANYDIPEAEGEVISSNYFGLLVAETAGLELSDYMDTVSEIMDEVPVIHDLGCIDGDGEYAEDAGELEEDQQAMLEDYEMLAYYNQFDRDEGDSFYEFPSDEE